MARSILVGSMGCVALRVVLCSWKRDCGEDSLSALRLARTARCVPHLATPHPVPAGERGGRLALQRRGPCRGGCHFDARPWSHQNRVKDSREVLKVMIQDETEGRNRRMIGGTRTAQKRGE